jgi:hypothetical protein
MMLVEKWATESGEKSAQHLTVKKLGYRLNIVTLGELWERLYFGGGKLLFLWALLRRSVIMQSGPEVNQRLLHFFFG